MRMSEFVNIIEPLCVNGEDRHCANKDRRDHEKHSDVFVFPKMKGELLRAVAEPKISHKGERCGIKHDHDMQYPDVFRLAADR